MGKYKFVSDHTSSIPILEPERIWQVYKLSDELLSISEKYDFDIIETIGDNDLVILDHFFGYLLAKAPRKADDLIVAMNKKWSSWTKLHTAFCGEFGAKSADGSVWRILHEKFLSILTEFINLTVKTKNRMCTFINSVETYFDYKHV